MKFMGPRGVHHREAFGNGKASVNPDALLGRNLRRVPLVVGQPPQK